MSFQQLTIIGVGLIGGSFALALKKSGFEGRIIGCDREPTLERALQLGVIDQGIIDPGEASRGSQLVMLAAPVSAIIDLIERIGPTLAPDTLLTDVGSTKRVIAERARAVFGANASARFLPGHPIAGKEKGGLESATPELFQGAAWVFCGDVEGAGRPFVELVRRIGARPMFMGSEQHDSILARTSHLPQMIATALAAQLDEDLPPAVLAEASGRALRDMTRLADSPYEVWRDIALTNADQIELALQTFEQRLAHLRENLRTRQLRDEFERAALFRAALRETNPDQ